MPHVVAIRPFRMRFTSHRVPFSARTIPYETEKATSKDVFRESLATRIERGKKATRDERDEIPRHPQASLAIVTNAKFLGRKSLALASLDTPSELARREMTRRSENRITRASEKRTSIEDGRFLSADPDVASTPLPLSDLAGTPSRPSPPSFLPSAAKLAKIAGTSTLGTRLGTAGTVTRLHVSIPTRLHVSIPSRIRCLFPLVGKHLLRRERRRRVSAGARRRSSDRYRASSVRTCRSRTIRDSRS